MGNVLIVDDHHLVCLGMGMLVKMIIADATLYLANNYEDALNEIKSRQMDLVILDLGIPGGIGTGMIKTFRHAQQNIRILVCTGKDELLNAPDYIQAGADGFLHKSSANDETKKAIRMVLEGKKYVSQAVQRKMFDSVLNREPTSNPIESLSPREKQVLELLQAGKWTKEIAEELNVKFSTVSAQKAKVFQKFRVENIVDLIRKVDLYTDQSRVPCKP
jgi:two-component system invasion response regulator UvrY